MLRLIEVAVAWTFFFTSAPANRYSICIDNIKYEIAYIIALQSQVKAYKISATSVAC